MVGTGQLSRHVASGVPRNFVGGSSGYAPRGGPLSRLPVPSGRVVAGNPSIACPGGIRWAVACGVGMGVVDGDLRRCVMSM